MGPTEVDMAVHDLTGARAPAPRSGAGWWRSLVTSMPAAFQILLFGAPPLLVLAPAGGNAPAADAADAVRTGSEPACCAPPAETGASLILQAARSIFASREAASRWWPGAELLSPGALGATVPHSILGVFGRLERDCGSSSRYCWDRSRGAGRRAPPAPSPREKAAAGACS
jgi:hypothetical protein